MPISEPQVRHLARLALLDLSAEEIAEHARHLDAIVGYVEQLAAVDTAGVEAVANVAVPAGGLRPDEPAALLPTATALAMAPVRGPDAYLVPKVVER